MLGTIITMGFVIVTLAVVAYALFEITPFAHHADRYHERGERQQSPHLN